MHSRIHLQLTVSHHLPLSFRVLFPNDLFWLRIGTSIVLVIDEPSFNFMKHISEFLDKDDLLFHTRLHSGHTNTSFQRILQPF